MCTNSHVLADSNETVKLIQRYWHRNTNFSNFVFIRLFWLLKLDKVERTRVAIGLKMEVELTSSIFNPLIGFVVKDVEKLPPYLLLMLIETFPHQGVWSSRDLKNWNCGLPSWICFLWMKRRTCCRLELERLRWSIANPFFRGKKLNDGSLSYFSETTR